MLGNMDLKISQLIVLRIQKINTMDIMVTQDGNHWYFKYLDVRERDANQRKNKMICFRKYKYLALQYLKT
jgi:hypothetical protein